MSESKYTLEMTKEELKLLTSIMMLVKFGGMPSMHKDWRPVVNTLAERLSLMDIRTLVRTYLQISKDMV